MVTKTSTRVEGLRALGEAMRGLTADMQGKVARAATNAAAQVVKKGTKAKIRSNPSIDSGSLLEAVIVKRVPPAQTDLTSEHIVTFRGRGKPTNKKGQRIARAPHAHLVEFGTVSMPAEPSLRPGLEENIQPATAAMAARLKQRIDKAGKR
jgi:HK97 gp10 family phage protein